MQIALICGYCGKVHTEDTESASVVFDFKQKQISFMCMNKGCRKDNVFEFSTWKENSKHSPLPSIKLV